MMHAFVQQVRDRATDGPLLGNAAGTVKQQPEIEEMLSAVDILTIGSITCDASPGNSGEVYYCDPQTGDSINALNLPNLGHKFYNAHLRRLIAIAHNQGKLVTVSVAGFDLHQYVDLYLLADEAGADCVELNFGCPNTAHPIPSYNLDYMHNVVLAVATSSGKAAITIKLSPQANPAERDDNFAHIASWPIDGVVALNTFGGGVMLRSDGRSAIRATRPDGIQVASGGLAGACLRGVSLTATSAARAALPDSMLVIRAGGVATGGDVMETGYVGADVSTLATRLLEEGPSVFNRLRHQAADLMTGEFV